MNQFWLKYFPSFIRAKLTGRYGLQGIIDNTGWLFIDKIIRMAGGLLLGVLVARHLGPEQYGILNYAGAFVALFGSFATLGLEGIIIRDIVNRPSQTNELLGSAFVLKLIGGMLTTILIYIIIYNAFATDNSTRQIVFITSLGLLFQATDVIDFYYKSEVKSKYTIIAKSGAFFGCVIARIYLLMTDAALIAFVLIGLIEIILSSAFLMIIYYYHNNNIFKWKIRTALMMKLLQDAWPLILSGFVIMIYMRIDQIMLANMVGNAAVGVYSAALRLSEVWYFIPLIISSSLAPAIINLKNSSQMLYIYRLQQLYTTMTYLSVSIAIFVTVFSDRIINFLYGNQYHDAAIVLSVHVWSGVFYFLGVAASNWYLVENLQKLAFLRTVYGAITNVILNIILIPKYGVVGAAIATLISQFIASYFSNIFDRRTLPVFRMQSKALLEVITLKIIFTGLNRYCLQSKK